MLGRVEWDQLLRDRFLVPEFDGVYVLGCFAKRVTFYSQQIRALNLAYGLLQSRKVTKNKHVAVIGAGVSGMTIAAALAREGAVVTIFEQLEKPLELLANSRQRFIHPNIYEWPDWDAQVEAAGLPVLDWNATEADRLAARLRRRWTELSQSRIEVHTGIENISIVPSQPHVLLRWKDGRAIRAGNFETVIIAVGFGLEKQASHQHSYWSDDDLDSGWHGKEQRWLISGYGDGAFTDLMRLAILDFRHGKIVQLFQSSSAFRGVVRDIQTIEERNADNPQRLSTHFEQHLQTKELEFKLKPFRRNNGPSIYLTGKTPHLYEPTASVLNRLIVLVLSRMNAFSWLPGPVVGEPLPLQTGGYHVTLGKADPVFFDRVLLRHGPESALKRSFAHVWLASAPLRAIWSSVDSSSDWTRKRQWPQGYFGPEIEDVNNSTSKPKASYLPAGPVFAKKMTMTREIQDDGGGISSYFIDGLCVTSGSIRKVRFNASVATGRMGAPERDALGEQLGLNWKPDPGSEIEKCDPPKVVFAKAPKIAGTFEFSSPLTPNTLPASFGFRVSSLNADALSSWEAEQLRSDVVRSWQPAAAGQFSATVVWFPLSELVLAVTIPRGAVENVRFSRWHLEKNGEKFEINSNYVRVDDELYLREPPSFTESDGWKWEEDHDFSEFACRSNICIEKCTSLAADAAPVSFIEYCVPHPDPGTRYMITWTLPPDRSNFWIKKIIDDTNCWRSDLLKLQLQPDMVVRQTHKIHERLAHLDKLLRDRYWNNEGAFEVSLFTYNEAHRKVEVVDGFKNGKEQNGGSNPFWVHFGFGLAGIALRQSNLFVYVKPPMGTAEPGLDFYMPLTGIDHEVLIAIPLSHPDFHDGLGMEYTRNRQVLAIVTIGTDSKDAHLRKLCFQDGEYLAALCHRQLLRPNEPTLLAPTTDPKPSRIGRKLTPDGWARHTMSTFSLSLAAQPDANFPTEFLSSDSK